MSSSSIHNQNSSSGSSEPELSAVQRWVCPRTGKPNFTRFHAGNLEDRTLAAADLFREGFYPSAAKASRELKVPYERLRSRLNGANPISQNGGKNTLLTDIQEQALLCWAHRRIAQGHHVQLRALQHNANAILKAFDRPNTASLSWAKSFMKRWKNTFHVKKSETRDVKRKAMQDRAHIEAFYHSFEQFIRENHIKPENAWNFDETGFMVGYLQKGTFVWTFLEIEQPILTDAHITVSVTSVESISAAGDSIAPFIILPGVNIPVKWVQNRLSDDTTITTSSKGYINDVLALK